jgi:hypothetical protein
VIAAAESVEKVVMQQSRIYRIDASTAGSVGAGGTASGVSAVRIQRPTTLTSEGKLMSGTTLSVHT